MTLYFDFFYNLLRGFFLRIIICNKLFKEKNVNIYLFIIEFENKELNLLKM